MESVVQVVLLMVAFAMLYIGAHWLVDASTRIGVKFGMPQIAVGLTIVAMGTSASEAVVSITSALEGNAEITIGNIVGSNILNVLLILGISALISSLTIQKNTVYAEIPIMFGVTVMLLIAGVRDNNVGRLEGVIFLWIFIFYLAYLFLLAIKDRKDKALLEVEAPENSKTSIEHAKTSVLFLRIVVSLILLIGSSDLAVQIVSAMATAMGVGDRMLGFTIIAIGTSLPELFTSVVAAKKGNADIVVGNIVGSCIFNILFVVGTVAVMTPVVFVPDFTIDTLIALAVCVLLFGCVFRKKELTRKHGILMLVLYVLYLVYLFFH
ncbi:MAG: calcium/sodium antiporter [Lachnospiraceae bacterium]|nr:calcium/sodium antiporter [Lachnospiraceae bacterium]